MYEKIMLIIIKITILTVWWMIGTAVKTHEDKIQIKKLRKYAKKVNKPILNLGCGRTEYGNINADITPKNVKNFMIIDANKKLPFKEKQFSSVFASNMIEHLLNPISSLKEMKRIANKVYIGYPHWWQLGTWLTPDHKWLVFSRRRLFIFKNVGGLRFVKYNPIPAYILIGFLILL